MKWLKELITVVNTLYSRYLLKHDKWARFLWPLEILHCCEKLNLSPNHHFSISLVTSISHLNQFVTPGIREILVYANIKIYLYFRWGVKKWCEVIPTNRISWGTSVSHSSSRHLSNPHSSTASMPSSDNGGLWTSATPLKIRQC